MKIRSVTYFCDPQPAKKEATLQKAAEFRSFAQRMYEQAGYEVQTTRLATTPFPTILPAANGRAVQEWAIQLEEATRRAGYAYLSIGPALPDKPESFGMLGDILAATKDVFTSGLMTSREGGVSLPAVRACAEVIHQAATITPDGFTNLRFAALANVPAGAPFFPAAYHASGEPAFALAIEAAGLAVAACKQASSLEEVRQALVASIQEHAQALENISLTLERQFRVQFGGVDFSLAPYPEETRSIGSAIERLGVPGVGYHGSLAAAAFLADTIERAVFHKAGFNGLFLPLLEDSTLSTRAAQGILTVKDLLLYSVVCGTGVDTVPLAGDTPVEALYALLLDVAALACRLDKPLTARLMPVPGKAAGEATGFDFEYFANSRVLALESAPLQGHLLEETWLDIQPRTRQAGRA